MGAAEILKLIATVFPLAQQLITALAVARHDATATDESKLEILLRTTAGMTPAIADLIRTLHNKSADDTLRVIGAITPAAADLIHALDAIHNQTAEQYAEVWAPGRDDWKNAVAMWNGSQFQLRTPATDQQGTDAPGT